MHVDIAAVLYRNILECRCLLLVSSARILNPASQVMEGFILYPGVDSSLPTKTSQLARSHLMLATAMTPPNNMYLQWKNSHLPPCTGWVEYTAIHPSAKEFAAIEKQTIFPLVETINDKNSPTECAELFFLDELCSLVKTWYKNHDQAFLTDYIPTHTQLELAYHLTDQGRNLSELTNVLPFPQMGDLTEERSTKVYFTGASNMGAIVDATTNLIKLETEYIFCNLIVLTNEDEFSQFISQSSMYTSRSSPKKDYL